MARTADSDQGDIPHHMASCSVYKLGVGVATAARGRLGIVQQVASNCILHRLLVYSIIIILSSFAVLLNCLYPNP